MQIVEIGAHWIKPVPKSFNTTNRGWHWPAKSNANLVFRRSSGVARVVAFFDVAVHRKPLSDTEKMHYHKTSLGGQAKAVLPWIAFISQSYTHAWDILCEKYGRSDFIVHFQFNKIHTHPPVRHDNSTSIVKFSNVKTDVVNTLF